MVQSPNLDEFLWYLESCLRGIFCHLLPCLATVGIYSLEVREGLALRIGRQKGLCAWSYSVSVWFPLYVCQLQESETQQDPVGLLVKGAFLFSLHDLP